ncbi:MAG TPA: class I SAM-dependent methyltransferase [Candidatus Saccharimonadales bacterium]|nr:class I SAM-dependent methyltransferase [Candidatus Saccharimonadales bacterium]
MRTVLNWIEAAKQGKLDLTLHTQNNKAYVANTARNIATIKKLVTERKKYRNSRGFKTVTPRPEFYELYDEQQILDIISNLDVYHEIPRQYNYFDGGADYWDKYAQKMAVEDMPNTLTRTIKLLDMNKSYIDNLFAGRKRVNVVDIGVGNALPVKDFLAYLLEQGVMNRYIGLDISAIMLQIARRNIKEWFGDKVPFEGYELDINYDRFANLLANEYIRRDSKDTINVLLLLGGTLVNLRAPDGALRVIHASMGRNDVLLHTQKLDTENSRRYFNFSLEPGKSPLSPNYRFIVDLLNIDESFYDTEMGFDEEKRQRYIRIRLKVALTLKFEFNEGERSVDLNKDDAILLWRAWHQNAFDVIEQFKRNDFHPLQISQTEDKEYILTISRIKSE